MVHRRNGDGYGYERADTILIERVLRRWMSTAPVLVEREIFKHQKSFGYEGCKRNPANATQLVMESLCSVWCVWHFEAESLIMCATTAVRCPVCSVETDVLLVEPPPSIEDLQGSFDTVWVEFNTERAAVERAMCGTGSSEICYERILFEFDRILLDVTQHSSLSTKYPIHQADM